MTVEETLSPKKMLTLGWVYLIILALASWVISSWSFAWSVLAGGLISIISFRVSCRDAMVFFDTLPLEQQESAEKAKKTKKGLILKFWLRFFLIGLVLFGLIKYSSVNVFGLILGLSTVVFAITFSAVGVVWRYYFSRR